MHHGREHERELVFAEVEYVALFDFQLGKLEFIPEELRDHDERLCVTHHRCGGVSANEILYVRGVVRLHVLYHEIVGFAPAESLFEVVQPLVEKVFIHGVHDRYLFVFYQV